MFKFFIKIYKGLLLKSNQFLIKSIYIFIIESSLLSIFYSQSIIICFKPQLISLSAMLKGIKKGNQGQSQENNRKQQKNVQAQPDLMGQMPIKFSGKNQKILKNQFIMQDEQEQNYFNQKYQCFDDKEHQNNLIEQQNQHKYQSQIQNDLKNKALQILQFFKNGDQPKVEQQILIFNQLQKTFFSKKHSLLKKQTNKRTQQQNIEQSDKNQKNKKSSGKFAYEFNYEQSDQQKGGKNKKSLKRSYRSRPIIKSQKVQNYCIHCPDNQQLRLISASNYVYLALPKRKTFNKFWHFILAPVQHQQTSIGLNEDVLTEINNYKKCLLQMFDKKNYIVVFWEQFYQQNSHIFIECLAVPFNKGQDFPFFFKQALQSIQGNWTTHKSIIKIQKQKGGLQKQIPKKIKYLYIDFSLGYGYAHAIQNQQYWKKDFCDQIIATAIGLQLYEVKTASQFVDQQLDLKQKQFKNMWEPYDWTKFI